MKIAIAAAVLLPLLKSAGAGPPGYAEMPADVLARLSHVHSETAAAGRKLPFPAIGMTVAEVRQSQLPRPDTIRRLSSPRARDAALWVYTGMGYSPCAIYAADQNVFSIVIYLYFENGILVAIER